MLVDPLTTPTVTTLLVPPAPLQLNENVVVAMSAPVLWLPLLALLPLHPPVAAHAVALVELQLNTALLPAATAARFAARVAVGMTLTVTLAGVLVPPGPAQAIP
jgi:hypothetical protein